jgi:glycosyltransferase involved in cell wall biosynthesis
MRIAIVTREASLNGGVGSYVTRLVAALSRAGHQVGVVHADRAAALDGVACRSWFVEGYDEYTDSGLMHVGAADVLARLAEFAPDVVHVQGCNNFVLEEQIRRRYAAIKTLHVYDFCPSGTKYHHLWRRPCTHRTGLLCVPRMIYKRCELSRRPAVIWRNYRRASEANRNNAAYARLIVASGYVKRCAVATGYAEEHIAVVPYFAPLPPTVLAPPAGRREVLFVGRVVRVKGLLLLLRALARIGEPWHLTVAGDGMDLPRARRLAERLGVAGRTTFLGWVTGERLARAYEQAWVVVMPSLWPEPFGMVGLEAMSYGRPVVAFAVGGIPEWLQDGATGWLVPPGDGAALAAKILWLLDRPGVAREMGMAGRFAVETRFDEATHVARLEALYRTVHPSSPAVPALLGATR